MEREMHHSSISLFARRACLGVFFLVLFVSLCAAEDDNDASAQSSTSGADQPSIFDVPSGLASQSRRATPDMVSYGCYNCLKRPLRVSELPESTLARYPLNTENTTRNNTQDARLKPDCVMHALRSVSKHLQGQKYCFLLQYRFFFELFAL
jgi:hypothetical protein